MKYDTIVIGAGAAGIAVASELASDPDHQVLLLEAGPARRSPQDWYTAVSNPEELWPRRHVTRSANSAPLPYSSGLGLGGSARINGMFALPGLPTDFDSWATGFEAPSWGWASVAPIVAELTARSSYATAQQRSPLDEAMYSAAADLGIATDVLLDSGDSGAGVIGLSQDSRGRTLAADDLQQEWPPPSNLTVICESMVIAIANGSPMSVQCSNGRGFEAQRIVLAAGVLGTPDLLSRAGVQRSGIGQNFRDHASIAIPLRMRRDGPAAYWMDIGIRLDARQPGDAMVLPFYRPHSRADGSAEAFLIAAVMCCESVGEVRRDAAGAISIEARQLTAIADIEAMDVALDTTCALIERIEDTAVPDDPDLMQLLHSMSGRQRAHAISAYPGRLFHGCGTARVGNQDDPQAVVDDDGKVFGWDDLFVMDASILPRIPRAPTHLTTSVIATHLARRLRDQLSQ